MTKKLKININTTEAIPRIQKPLITDEQLEQVKQELKEYWEENIYQKNPPVNPGFLPKAEKEQLEKIKNGKIKNLNKNVSKEGRVMLSKRRRKPSLYSRQYKRELDRERLVDLFVWCFGVLLLLILLLVVVGFVVF